MIEVCEVRDKCKLKCCEDPENRWITLSNCSCRECLVRSMICTCEGCVVKEENGCEFSGDAYNTDGDCLMMK
jgi:hypothetical protein